MLGEGFSGWLSIYTTGRGEFDGKGLVNKAREYFTTFNIPEEIATDGGPQLTSDVFQKSLKAWGVRHRLVLPVHSSWEKRRSQRNQSLPRRRLPRNPSLPRRLLLSPRKPLPRSLPNLQRKQPRNQPLRKQAPRSLLQRKHLLRSKFAILQNL